MIRLLIVDDEEEIRSGIKNSVNWEANGIEICGEAGNGRAALELVSEKQPDIMLIDIRMPVMSGLEVIENLYNGHCSTRSVILSGYDEFSYAQQALKFGAADYLLKPCRPQEILNTVLRVKTELEEERDKKEVLKRLKIRFNESLPLLKDKYLSILIKNSEKALVHISDNLTLYKVSLTDSPIVVAVIRIDDYGAFSMNYSSEDIELFKFAVKNIADETLGASSDCEVFQNGNEIVALVNACNDEQIFLLLKTVKANIRSCLGFSVSIGVGRVYEGISRVGQSYIEAVKSIEATFFLGSDTVIRYAEVMGFNDEETTYPINEETELINCIKCGKWDELEEKLNYFFNALSARTYSKEVMLQSGLALTLSLYHLCLEKNIETGEIFGNIQLSLDSLLKIDSLANLKVRLIDLSTFICERLSRKKSSNRLIEAAIKYIDKNYHRDLSLEAVAGEVFITPSYLSLLFKQAMGINFVDYLHKIRIEKACEILRDIRLKTYEVASKVGYNDEKYFSQLFKKYTGMTPTQYRSSI